MAKVFIYPATSLILSDLVARHGHTPLSSAVAVRERIQTALDSYDGKNGVFAGVGGDGGALGGAGGNGANGLIIVEWYP